GRAGLALIFLVAGFGKITGYAGTAAYMNAMGVPGALLPLVIALEIGGGIALLVGWQTRLTAFLLAGFSVLSGLIFHLVPSFGLEAMAAQAEMTSFLKNVAIAGGLLLLIDRGPGELAIDSRRAVAA